MKLDKYLIRVFAEADSDVQAELINLWGRELFVSCRGHDGFDSQCCYVSSSLDKDGAAFIRALFGYVELREKEI